MVLLLAASTMLAVPARRSGMKVLQPDGTSVTIRLHGDEWLHFTTTSDGYTVRKNAKGYYVYAERHGGVLRETDVIAHDSDKRTADETAFLRNAVRMQVPQMSARTATMKQLVEEREASKRRSPGQQRRAAQYDYNNFKGLIILVQWNDREFSRDDYRDIVADMVNKENYTGYGTRQFTGSVRDYFSDNSFGKFKPEFDVVGPYTVGYSQYDYNGTIEQASALITMEAINKADADGVDFSQYDGDGDGIVDLVYFIMAGYGANFDGNDDRLWWPHRSMLFNPTTWQYIMKDGVYLVDYASSVELQGYTNWPASIKIDGIGTICHEFSHVLGLPDFYDTNYEEDGQSNDPGRWSLMAGGSYENEGRTPVGYSLYERYSVGFIDEPEVVTGKGIYTLQPLATSGEGYRLDTPVENEFFLLENRQRGRFKWDAYLPGNGMLVYRVDFTSQRAWNNNTVNADPSHNYYELLRAGGWRGEASPYDPFPGTGRKRELTNASSPAHLKTWDGLPNDFGLVDIQQVNGNISFSVAGYDVTALTLDETLTLGTGLSRQLTEVPVPSYAQYALTWASNDKAVAMVDANGVVTGVAAGDCVITATTDNGVQASCQVTVEETSEFGIGGFRLCEDDTEGAVVFDEAQVLYVHQNNAFVRDATGCIMVDNSQLNLAKDEIISGKAYFKRQTSNLMPWAVSTNMTNPLALTITAGRPAEPREVALGDLTAADYADYVLVKQAQLVTDGVVWAVADKGKARLFNHFGISLGRLTGYEGKYFDIPAIFGTDMLDGEVINELYMMGKPIEVDGPDFSAIREMDSRRHAAGAVYNLSGQRVADGYQGLVIQDGRKCLMK